MDKKVEKLSPSRRREIRKWLRSPRQSQVWYDVMDDAGGNEKLAEELAENAMFEDWARRTFKHDLFLFDVWNNARQPMHVLAETVRQAKAIALREGHLAHYDAGECEKVVDCAARWGAGFASGVEKAKAYSDAGPLKRGRNCAIMYPSTCYHLCTFFY